MEWLKRWLWILNAITIVLVTRCLASATSDLVTARYLLGPSGPRAPKPPAPASPTRTKDTEAIVRRNLFCSTCPPPLPATPAPEAEADTEPIKTTLPLVLVTTLLDSEPGWSMAILRDRNTKESGAFRHGSVVPGNATLHAIEETRIYLRLPDGHLEYVDLRDGVTPGAPAPVAAVARAPQGAAADLDRDIEAGVKKLADSRYTLQRALLDKVLANTNLLARSARIVPAVVNGQPSGFKLYAIKPNSLYARIGMQNGDTIRAINGHEMTSPDRALEVYTRLRAASHLTVSILRRGKEMALEYSIVNG